MYFVVLSLAQLTCSSPGPQPGIEDARIAGPSFEQVRCQIKHGMSEHQVSSLLAPARLPSGQPVRVQQVAEHVLRVQISKLYHVTYYFNNDKLWDIATFDVRNVRGW